MPRASTVLLVAALAFTACSTQQPASSPSASSVDVAATVDVTATVEVATLPPAPDQATPDNSTTTASGAINDVVADRPFDVVVPRAYDGTTPMPLVVLLHGFGITGAMQDDFFHFRGLADSRGFLMVSPDGTRNADGSPFWNATDACCGFGASVDDSSYLAALIKRVQADYVVDAQRVFLIGFSNGGFMSYRMACDHAETIAAIVSISAATFLDSVRCAPTEPVSVLEIHGTDDETIGYDGGRFEGTAYPSAPQTVAQWAGYNECGGAPTVTEAALDLDRVLATKETNVLRYQPCAHVGAVVELWTIVGGKHVPNLSSSFGTEVIDFLLAHPKTLA